MYGKNFIGGIDLHNYGIILEVSDIKLIEINPYQVFFRFIIRNILTFYYHLFDWNSIDNRKVFFGVSDICSGFIENQ